MFRLRTASCLWLINLVVSEASAGASNHSLCSRRYVTSRSCSSRKTIGQGTKHSGSPPDNQLPASQSWWYGDHFGFVDRAVSLSHGIQFSQDSMWVS